MSVDEVKRMLRRGNDAAGHGGETLRRALVEAKEAGALAMATAHDSQHSYVAEAAAGLRALDGEVDQALRRFESAARQAGAYASGI
nr:hypothetical protein [Micromonospora sp. DSM 115978]